MTIAARIEALLFTQSDPISLLKLGQILGVSEAGIREGITELDAALAGHGLVLVEVDGMVALRTHPDAAQDLDAVRKDEDDRELTKSAVETLAVVLYHPRPSKAEIDYVRGVNTSVALRTLSVRGLVEKVQDQQGVYYAPSIDLLGMLGITNRDAMPDFAKLSAAVEGVISQKESSHE